MKNADGQLYTIEGFAAGLIMLITAYLVVNATSVYTAGDTHINDMQLEALGTDALTIMGTPTDAAMYKSGSSPLRMIIENPVTLPNETFKAMFLNLTNNETGAPLDYTRVDSTMDYIQFTANYTCREKNTDEMQSHPISYSRNLTGGEHTVRTTKWVMANKGGTNLCGTTDTDRAVLVEVLLWRD
jgi:hypothetical protein